MSRKILRVICFIPEVMVYLLIWPAWLYLRCKDREIDPDAAPYFIASAVVMCLIYTGLGLFLFRS